MSVVRDKRSLFVVERVRHIAVVFQRPSVGRRNYVPAGWRIKPQVVGVAIAVVVPQWVTVF